MFSTMALAGIVSAFQEAGPLCAHSNGYHKFYSKSKLNVANQALAFIQGTGLDIAIKVYDLGYDPEVLRNAFFRIFHVKRQS